MAYCEGWNESDFYSNIFIDFGRQTSASGGVELIGGTSETDLWVTQVAQAFLDGYNDNHPSNGTDIAVATNNADDAWQCNESGGAYSSNWYSAGQDWGGLVAGLTSQSRAWPISGNDIESWINSFGDGWTACGIGTESWLSGYESKTTLTNENYGSEAYNEDPSQWQQAEVYQLSWGQSVAIVYPDIYATGNASEWAALWNLYTNMFISGVTSENGAGGSLSAASSWDDLYNDLSTEPNGNGSSHLDSYETVI